jgi:hypothetical protein
LLTISLPAFECFLENGIALDVGARPTFPRAAKPGHAMADMEKESLSLLLAVVADVDAGFDLFRHDRMKGGTAFPFDFALVDLLAAGAAGI